MTQLCIRVMYTDSTFMNPFTNYACPITFDKQSNPYGHDYGTSDLNFELPSIK